MRLGKGGSVTVGRQLATGGQGAVYDVEGDPTLVFKRLHDAVLAKAPEMRDRVQAMVSQPPRTKEERSGHLVLAWPTDLVFDGTRFVGLVMPKVDIHSAAELHVVANPSDREHPGPWAPSWVPTWTWKYLLQAASNLALATQLLHERGYVIGDFNERNILVQADARVTLVDCDSMQVKDTAGHYYLCTVGRPEFTAPELADVDLRTTPRKPSSDLFALAVHIHQLLLEGLHPFDGVWRGEGDKPSRSRLARVGAYVHGNDPRLVPPSSTIPIDLLPRSTRQLFLRAFVDGARDPAKRPTGREWRNELQAIAQRLSTCEAGHDYPSSRGRRCPWCQLEELRISQTALSPPSHDRRQAAIARRAAMARRETGELPRSATRRGDWGPTVVRLVLVIGALLLLAILVLQSVNEQDPSGTEGAAACPGETPTVPTDSGSTFG